MSKSNLTRVSVESARSSDKDENSVGVTFNPAVDSASKPSLDVTGITLTAGRMRRRSELAGVANEGPERSEDKHRKSIHSNSHLRPVSHSDHDGIELSPIPNMASADQMQETNSIDPVLSASRRVIYRRNGRIHFAALCYASFLNGWNDGSTGPLLPTIERYYHIGFAVVSLLFVTNCLGFLSGAIANVWSNHRFGIGKVMVVGAIIQLIGYSMMAPGGPFPIMCIGFACAGFGLSLQNAQANGFVGSLKEDTRIKFGFLHAAYGLGALVAPLVATHFASSAHWSFHYLVSAGIAMTNLAVLIVVFRFRSLDEVMAEAGQALQEAAETSNLYRKIMRLKEIHYLATFSLIYVGVEVSIGGWIVTFVEDKRGGGASAGYISSGFFAGLMLGRIVLMQLNRKLGERWVIVYYSLMVIILEVTIWVVPSLIENAIAVSFVGLLMGPIYPILMNHSSMILPMRLLTGCVGYIGAIGLAGSAVLPFITAVISSRFGIASLQPFIVSMVSTMIVIWALVPKVRRIE